MEHIQTKNSAFFQKDDKYYLFTSLLLIASSVYFLFLIDIEDFTTDGKFELGKILLRKNDVRLKTSNDLFWKTNNTKIGKNSKLFIGDNSLAKIEFEGTEISLSGSNTFIIFEENENGIEIVLKGNNIEIETKEVVPKVAKTSSKIARPKKNINLKINKESYKINKNFKGKITNTAKESSISIRSGEINKIQSKAPPVKSAVSFDSTPVKEIEIKKQELLKSQISLNIKENHALFKLNNNEIDYNKVKIFLSTNRSFNGSTFKTSFNSSQKKISLFRPGKYYYKVYYDNILVSKNALLIKESYKDLNYLPLKGARILFENNIDFKVLNRNEDFKNQFTIELSTNESFENIFEKKIMTQNSFTLETTTLSLGLYFWRVIDEKDVIIHSSHFEIYQKQNKRIKIKELISQENIEPPSVVREPSSIDTTANTPVEIEPKIDNIEALRPEETISSQTTQIDTPAPAKTLADQSAQANNNIAKKNEAQQAPKKLPRPPIKKQIKAIYHIR